MLLLIFSVYRLDSSWWRCRRPHLLPRDPGTAELRWWSLDSEDICLILRNRRATYRLVSAAEPICGRFNREHARKARHPCLTLFSLKPSLHLLRRGRISSGQYIRRAVLVRTFSEYTQ